MICACMCLVRLVFKVADDHSACGWRSSGLLLSYSPQTPLQRYT